MFDISHHILILSHSGKAHPHNSSSSIKASVFVFRLSQKYKEIKLMAITGIKKGLSSLVCQAAHTLHVTLSLKVCAFISPTCGHFVIYKFYFADYSRKME